MQRLLPPPVDAAIAGLFVLFVVAEAALSPDIQSPVFHLAVAGSAMASLAWRNRFPVVVAALVMATNAVMNPEGQFATVLALVVVAYSNGAAQGPPRSYVGLAVLVVPFLGVLAALEGLEPSDLAAAGVFLVGPWAVGTAMRQRALRTAQAEDRAQTLEREREAHVAAATAAERTRIARELHDIVSHSLSVITIQSQAVRRRLAAEQTSEAADLAEVEDTAREALAEMRRLFGILRSDGEAASLSPQPGLDDLERLSEHVRASGLEVQVRVEGAAYGLPGGLDLAAYRIIQEGLTNALRHSGASVATVLLRYHETGLEITVEDDGRGIDPAVNSTGHGLVGVRERVSLYDGTVEVVPGEGCGTRLVARLPLTGPR